MPKPVQQIIKGRWGPGTAGGCPRVSTWTNNPQYLLKPTDEAGGNFSITLRCNASPKLDIGFVVLRQSPADKGGRMKREKVRKNELLFKTTWRPSDVASAEVDLSTGEGDLGFIIVPCTYEAGHQAAFELAVVTTNGASFAFTELKEIAGAGGTVSGSAGAAAAPKPSSAPPNKPAPPSTATAASTQPAPASTALAPQRGRDPAAVAENEVAYASEGQGLSNKQRAETAELIEAAIASCAGSGGLYEDPEFPASKDSLWLDGSNPGSELRQSGLTTDPVVSWRRPSEFASSLQPSDGPVRLFYEDWGVQGVIASPLLNHWLLAACNIIGGDVEVLQRVFVDVDHASKGFYVVRFYVDDPASDDDWKVVLVDDRLPCGTDGLPCFARNPTPSVLWMSLIEKAFAKLKGSYEATGGGSVEDGLLYLTGGLSREVGIMPSADPSMVDALWAQMMEWWTSNHVIGVEHRIDGEPSAELQATGLLPNLPYCVVTGGEPMGAGRMVRLRTFHGYTEWRGKWCDGDSNWTPQLRQMMQYDDNTDDGTFWMSFDDFVLWFNVLFVCRMADERWTRLTMRSKWMDMTAGGCCPNFASWRSNPQWLIKTSQQLRLTVSLSVPQPSATDAVDGSPLFEPDAAIGISVLKGNPGADAQRRKLLLTSAEELVVRAEPRPVRRLVQEISLEPSESPYILVPHTFAPGREMPFNLVIRCDDENDDGIPDFQLEPVRPETDWYTATKVIKWADVLSPGSPANGAEGASPAGGMGGIGGTPGSAGFATNPRLTLSVPGPANPLKPNGGRFWVIVDQLSVANGGSGQGAGGDEAFPALGVALMPSAAVFDDGVVEPSELLQSEQATSDAVAFACELAPSETPYCLVPFLADGSHALAMHPELSCRVCVYSDVPFTLGSAEDAQEATGKGCGLTVDGKCICWGLGRFPEKQTASNCVILKIHESLKRMERGMDRQLKYLDTLGAWPSDTVPGGTMVG